MKLFCLIAALGLAWVWPLSAAQAEPVIVKNDTGRSICEVYLAPAGTHDWAGWGGDGRCLEPGRKWSLKLKSPASTGGRNDLKVIFDDGGERTYYGLDLNLFVYVVLGELEAELFEWDPSGRPAK